MKTVIVLLSALLFIGCCGTKEVIVQRDTIRVPIFEPEDTLYQGPPIFPRDTVYQFVFVSSDHEARVDTVLKKIYLRRTHIDTLKIPVSDTIQKVVYRDADPSEWWIFLHSIHFWLSALAFGILLAAGVVIAIMRR